METMKDLSKEVNDIVSFEKLDPSLFIFHEDSQSYSIITNKSEKDKEYLELMHLQNYWILNEEKYLSLPNYKSYKQIDFLKEIKGIFGINNKITKEEMAKDDEEKEEIDDYENEKEEEEKEEEEELEECENDKE